MCVLLGNIVCMTMLVCMLIVGLFVDMEHCSSDYCQEQPIAGGLFVIPTRVHVHK